MHTDPVSQKNESVRSQVNLSIPPPHFLFQQLRICTTPTPTVHPVTRPVTRSGIPLSPRGLWARTSGQVLAKG